MKEKLLLFIIIILGLFLRTYQLEHYPPGFYSDEASWAYNAYSILKTGNDEYGRTLPWSFEAFGDYKLPVTVYSIIPSFILFGVNNWSARLPTALYGTATILALYFLTKEILKLKTGETSKNSFIHKYTPLVSALFLAVTPSHIFLSRGIWDIAPALFFTTAGALFLIKWINIQRAGETHKTKNFLQPLLSALSFVLALYSYNSARVFVPLLITFSAIIFHKDLVKFLIPKKKINNLNLISLILPIILALILLLPQIKSLRSPEVIQRAKYVSIFYHKEVDTNLYNSIHADTSTPLLLTRLFHNKVIAYVGEITENYLSHFDPNFLFITGDTFEIFQMIGLGFLPFITLPFLLIGLYKIYTEKPTWSLFILTWLLLSPVASSLTVFTPSISRAQNMVIPLVLISAYGLAQILESIHKKYPELQRIVFLTIIIIIMSHISFFLKQYFITTPRYTAEKWNEGFEKTANIIKEREQNYEKIIVSSSKAPSYIFLLWYLKYDPVQFQKENLTDHQPDEHGLNFTTKFGKYLFTKDIKTEQKNLKPGENALLVGFEDEVVDSTLSVYSRNGKIVSQIKE